MYTAVAVCRNHASRIKSREPRGREERRRRHFFQALQNGSQISAQQSQAVPSKGQRVVKSQHHLTKWGGRFSFLKLKPLLLLQLGSAGKIMKDILFLWMVLNRKSLLCVRNIRNLAKPSIYTQKTSREGSSNTPVRSHKALQIQHCLRS